MRHFVYKTTCTVNGKYYIGVHTEYRDSDGYIGCGVSSNSTAISLQKRGVKSAFIDSVVKYGYENFKREIIKEFDSREEAYKFEESIVNKELIGDSSCLNIRVGGIGGRSLSLCKPIDILNSRTGEILSFDSRSDCASFLGLKNISNIKRFLGGEYVIKGEEIPISIKKGNEPAISFYDIYEASRYTGLSIFNLKRLLKKQRKSCRGWFLADFDFNSSYYKNAKKIRNGK